MRAELKSAAFVFLIHDSSKIYFGKLLHVVIVHDKCHRRWLQKKKLF